MIHGITPESIPNHIHEVVNSFVYGGVNIFFLISGHFGIKFSVRSLVKFTLTILFFNIVNIAMLGIVGAECNYVSETISALFFPLSPTWWFIRVYILLMISAPLLNAGLRALGREQLGYLLLLFTIAIIWSKTHNASFNYLNGAYLYCIGFYLKEIEATKFFSRKTLLTLFVISCLSLSIIDYIGARWVSPLSNLFSQYDNAFILTASVSIYLYFSKLSFQSQTVNTIASCALGCYLLQDGQFGKYFLYDWQHKFLETHGFGIDLTLMFTATFVAFWLLSFIHTL